jgi:hypothetical protein
MMPGPAKLVNEGNSAPVTPANNVQEAEKKNIIAETFDAAQEKLAQAGDAVQEGKPLVALAATATGGLTLTGVTGLVDGPQPGLVDGAGLLATAGAAILMTGGAIAIAGKNQVSDLVQDALNLGKNSEVELPPLGGFEENGLPPDNNLVTQSEAEQLPEFVGPQDPVQDALNEKAGGTEGLSQDVFATKSLEDLSDDELRSLIQGFMDRRNAAFERGDMEAYNDDDNRLYKGFNPQDLLGEKYKRGL